MNRNERSFLDSDLLRTFVTIAEYGNLTAAAGHIGRTQSAISVQLRKLETRLGTPLFARTSKGMTLTAAGETLLTRATAILSDLRETERVFSDRLTGSIRLGMPDDFDAVVLERVLLGFSRAHPGVQVLAVSGCTAGYGAAIDRAELDVAVASGPGNTRGIPLNVEQTIWAARKGCDLHRRDVLPLAILDRTCWWRDLPVNALREVGRAHRVAFKSSSFASLRSALRAGFAIGLLPQSSLEGDLQVLTASYGLPDLPRSRRSILVSKQAPSEIADAMVEAIIDARRPEARAAR